MGQNLIAQLRMTRSRYPISHPKLNAPENKQTHLSMLF
nr:MAG TPA: hypothetical protein [Caudoviricetes sp.]